jgi:hypothetical protein
VGGNAFPDVIPVPRSDCEFIVDYFIAGLGNPKYAILGSTGKKNLMGDIDIAVSDCDLTFLQLRTKLELLLGANNVNTKGKSLNQIYTRYTTPSGDGPYQVDFMLGDPVLLNFTHWSPVEGSSRYSGSHRTELIKAVAKSISPFRKFDGNKLLARVGYTLYHDIGLVFNCRWCPPRKDNKGFTSKMVSVPRSDIDLFHSTFTDIPKQPSYVVTDPIIIVELLFGNMVKINDLNSCESTLTVITKNESLDSSLIWRLYTQRLDEIKLPHPRISI